jgi:hypothetical protein
LCFEFPNMRKKTGMKIAEKEKTSLQKAGLSTQD